MQRGFSLVELSIVLVIVGLLAGGIVVGADMVKAAGYRAVGTDMVRLRTAFNTFRVKYNAMPGDMKNAISYWGSAGGMRNGDGNGMISWAGDANCDAAHVFWHLNLSGISKESPHNMYGTATWPAHYIKFRLDESIVYAYYGDLYSDAAVSSRSSNAITVAKYVGGNAGVAALPPEAAQQIDAKSDDGLPFAGKITGHNGFDEATVSVLQNCVSSNAYVATSTTPACRMIFWLD